jgi:hypothetical protein
MAAVEAAILYFILAAEDLFYMYRNILAVE